MDKFPLLTAPQLAKALKKMGFVLVRQKGSHMFFRNPDGRTTVIPNHPGEKIDRGLLVKIVKHDLHIEKEELMKYL